MGKFNKQIKGKEKRELKKAQEEFNPSAREPFKEPEEGDIAIDEAEEEVWQAHMKKLNDILAKKRAQVRRVYKKKESLNSPST